MPRRNTASSSSLNLPRRTFTDSGAPILPCGACLQALAEFGGIEVVVRAPAVEPVALGEPADELAGLRVVALDELLRAPFRTPRPEP